VRVLFITKSKTKESDLSPFILSQLNSILELGVDVISFPIHGRGILAYFRGSKQIRSFLKTNEVDILHAHYTLCGWSAVLARSRKPVILSLMGSDALGEFKNPGKTKFSSKLIVLLTLLIQPFVQSIISKSANINKRVYRKNITRIIPNGIDLVKFKPDNKLQFKEELGLEADKKYVLFLNNPENKWKNLMLVQKALSILSEEKIELITPYPVSHSNVVKYLNAADVLAHTSFMEGSPNIIKEAMACNCPIVSTDAGDVRWVIGDTPGCYITSFEPEDVAEKLKLALTFAEQNGKTNGRQRIIELGLDSSSIAKRILDVYENVLKKSNKF
jgi:glycosyltransferase involved in cell wall biosynthesis